MSKPDAGAELKKMILEKETEHKIEGELLKEQFHLAYESIKPINIIKNTFKEIVFVPGIRENAINSAMGLSAGFIAKKLFTGRSHSLVKNILGFILEIAVAGRVSKNADEIKAFGGTLLKKIITRGSKTENIL